MNRRSIILVWSVIPCSTVWNRTVTAQDDFPLYVGQAVCSRCHAPDREGTASGEPNRSMDVQRGASCALERIDAHARAHNALQSEAAAAIALISGVAEPPVESRVCLSCHGTGADEGPRWVRPTFRVSDGVQCEACHGPGSRHVEKASKERDGVTIPVDSSVMRPGSRQQCVRCHFDRPSHREVLDHGFRPYAADHRYKSPVDLVVAPDGERLFAACRQSNSVLEIDAVERRVTREAAVGRRPVGLALDPDGGRLFVSNRMGRSVSVIDLETFRVIAEIPVGAEPHGLAFGPSGRNLYVLNTGENTVSVIDGQSLREVRRLSAGHGPWSLAVDAEGHRCLLTSVRPDLGRFRDPPTSELTIVNDREGFVAARVTVNEANMLQGVAFDPTTGTAVFTLMRTKNLVPITRLAQGWVITNGLGVLWPDGRVDQLLLDKPNHAYPDLMDVVVTRDGQTALVTSGGADEVVVVDLAGLRRALQSMDDRERRDVWPNHLGRGSRFVTQTIGVGANPQAIALSPDGRFAYVANALDDSIGVIELKPSAFRLIDTIALGGPGETTRIRRGEKLFHSAGRTFGRQFSCRSCHPDGHTNGLTFDIEADGIGLKPVDNRTLQGILDTPPFKWEGINPSLHRQCGRRLSVFFTRLQPLAPGELDDLVLYMCTIERPPNRRRSADGLTVQQRRGKVVFERTAFHDGRPIPSNQRCVECHHGAYFTNRSKSAVNTAMWLDAWLNVDLSNWFQTDEFGELGTYYFIDAGLPPGEWDVPHLNNIGDSAPYLHNGAGRTLEEIWTRFNLTDGHGATADMTREQFNDLIAYLKSL